MTISDVTDLPTTGDLVDLHREMAVDHAEAAESALARLRDLPEHLRRDTLLNQQIGVNLKLADVHARLALAVARSGGQA